MYIKDCCLKFGCFYPRAMHVLQGHFASGETTLCNIRSDADLDNCFGCDICDFTCDDKDKVVRHQKKEHPQERGRNRSKIVCLLCEKTHTGGELTIQSHFVEVHKFFQCTLHCPFPGCKEVFAYPSPLKKHLTQPRKGHALSELEAKKKAKEVHDKVYPKILGGKSTKVSRKLVIHCECKDFHKKMEKRDRENKYTVNRKDAFSRHIQSCKIFKNWRKERGEEACRKRWGSLLDLVPCPECDIKPFPNECDMRTHLQKVHRNEKIPCDVCGKPIKSHNMQRHLDDHDPDIVFSCLFEGCKERPFKTQAFLDYHVDRYHSEEKPCPIWMDPISKEKRDKDDPRSVQCPYRYFTRGGLWTHIIRVHAPKEFSCEFTHCGSAFGSQRALNRHVIDSHTPKHPCFFCQVKTVTIPELRDHILSHEVYQKECECGEKFYLGEHFDHHHMCCQKGKETVLKCKTCRWNRLICKDIGQRGSQGEVAIAQALTYFGIPFRKEVAISKRVIHNDESQKGKYHFDFCVTFDSDINVFVEYDGCFHFRPSGKKIRLIGQVYRDLAKTRYALKSDKTKIVRVTGNEGDFDMLRRFVDLNLTWTREDGTRGSSKDILEFLKSYTPKPFNWIKSAFVHCDAKTFLDKSGLLKKVLRDRDVATEVTIPSVVKVTQSLKHCPKILMHRDDDDETLPTEVGEVHKKIFKMREAIALIFLRENRELSEDFLESDELNTVGAICSHMPEFQHLVSKKKRSSHSIRKFAEKRLKTGCQ